jgi:hypothetical protein
LLQKPKQHKNFQKWHKKAGFMDIHNPPKKGKKGDTGKFGLRLEKGNW